MNGKFRLGVRYLCLAAATLFALATGPSAHAADTEWIRQFGTIDGEEGLSIAADNSGHLYVLGRTTVFRTSPPGGNYFEPFLSKLDTAGNMLWTHKIGDQNTTETNAMAADGMGNHYVTGALYDGSDLPRNETNAYLTKYDPDGIPLWTRTIELDAYSSGHGASADGLGNIYVAGDVSGGDTTGRDAFVSKFDDAGNLLWTREFGSTKEDLGRAVAADHLGNVFVVGDTYGDFAGPHLGSPIIFDSYLTKYDADGNFQWIRPLSTVNWDFAFSVAADGRGNAYVSGASSGDMGGPYLGGFHDPYILKYDSDGNRLWGRQDGTADADQSFSVAADSQGNAYIAGHTDGKFGAQEWSLSDAFVAKYDPVGNLQWVRQFGGDGAQAVAVNHLGEVFTTGDTYDDLAGINAGRWDVFIAKIVVPEPASITGVVWILVILSSRRSRRAVRRGTPPTASICRRS